MKIPLLRFFGVALLAGAFLMGAPAAAQGYPERPIRLILPYGTGGNTDVVSRILSPYMSADLGQQVVVENRGGGASIPGMLFVAKASPDGYTLLFAASNLASNPKVKEVLASLGAEPAGGTPAELGAHLTTELARWEKLAQHVTFKVAD